MRIFERIALLLFLLTPAAGFSQDAADSPAPLMIRQLPRENQLLFHTATGAVGTAKTVEEWDRRKQESMRGLASVLGELPGDEKRCPLDMKIEEETDGGAFVRRRISIQTEPGSRLRAYLLIPKKVLENPELKVRGILSLHGTHQNGPDEMVGLGKNKDRMYAKELAEQGAIVIAPNYPLLGEYQPDLKTLGWKSGTLKAVWDNIRCLDLLDSLPNVQQGAYAAIGHSLGGHNSVYTALFDERIKAVVTSCGLDAYPDYYDGNPSVWKPGKGWTQDRYIPLLGAYRDRLNDIPCDFYEMVSALAPRRVLIIAPEEDSNFRAASVDRIVAAAGPVFALHGVPNHLECIHPPGGHDFPPAMRVRAYQFLDQMFTDVLETTSH